MAGRKGQRKLSARTTQRQKLKFLEAYARLGNATAAQEETGVSRYCHIRWLKQPEYRKQFEAAEDAAIELLELEARKRATEGREESVWYLGSKVGTVRKPSDLLLIFLLKAKRPDVYRERFDVRGNQTLNVQSAVKVVHEYHESGPTIDVTAVEQFPNKQLMSASEVPQASTTLTEAKVGKGANTLSKARGTGTPKVPVAAEADYSEVATDYPMSTADLLSPAVQDD